MLEQSITTHIMIGEETIDGCTVDFVVNGLGYPPCSVCPGSSDEWEVLSITTPDGRVVEFEDLSVSDEERINELISKEMFL